METPRTWAVLLPIRKQHAANIYAGTKTLELRKKIPTFMPGTWEPVRCPFRVYMYESKADGGAGAITGFFDCPAYVGICKQSPEERYPAGIAQDAQVSPEYVEEYGGMGWVYAWKVKNPTRFPEPVALSALGIDRAPQSWRYLGTDACKVLEVAAHGSPAE